MKEKKETEKEIVFFCFFFQNNYSGDSKYKQLSTMEKMLPNFYYPHCLKRFSRQLKISRIFLWKWLFKLLID